MHEAAPDLLAALRAFVQANPCTDPDMCPGYDATDPDDYYAGRGCGMHALTDAARAAIAKAEGKE